MSGVPYDPDNVFARILRGELPCTKVLETEHCLAILDAFPVAHGHTLLLPKAPFVTVADMSGEAAAEVGRCLPALVRAVKAATGAEGINIVQNNHAAAGQEVFHAHFHLIPRFAGDNLVRLGSGRQDKLDPEEGARVAATIRGNLQPSLEPPAPRSVLWFLLQAHALVLQLHTSIHRVVDDAVVRACRALVGRLLG